MAKHFLDNPLGAKGFSGRTVRVGTRSVGRSGREGFHTGGERSHLMHFGWKSGKKYALCGAGKDDPSTVMESEAKIVDCYRCLKILRMESSGAVLAKRDLRAFGGKRESNTMIPGGREGVFVSGKKRSPNSPHGSDLFIGGTKSHPTQPQMLPGRAKAARRAKMATLQNPYEVPVDFIDILGESDHPGLLEDHMSDIMKAIRGSKDPIGSLERKADKQTNRTKARAFHEAALALTKILE